MGEERRPRPDSPFKHGVLHIDDIAVLQRLPRIRIDQVENDRRQEQDRIIPDDLREKAVLTADEHLVGQPQQILGQKQRHRIGDEDTELCQQKQGRIWFCKVPNPF